MIDADSIDAFQAALPRIEPSSLKPTRNHASSVARPAIPENQRPSRCLDRDGE